MNPECENLIDTIARMSSNIKIKEKFISRIRGGQITRDENPKSHICVYFAAYDSLNKLVFIGKHIKSGLWLFNGGHLDKNETIEHALYREMGEEWGVIQKDNAQSPSLLTLTQIENPKKQTCELHYDVWYFIPISSTTFNPDKKLLSQEFFEWGWKTINEAKSLVQDKAALEGLGYINSILT